MDIKKLFDDWAADVGGRFSQKQWMLSKWENIEGIDWTDEKTGEMVADILEGLKPEGCGSLVDLGCGGGWIAKELSPFFKEVLGCDFSIEMIKQAKGTIPSRGIVCGDIRRLPFFDESFDRVLCYFVLINMAEAQAAEEVLGQIVRVLKRGGRALIGQIPDAARSEEFDAAKKEHVKRCKENLNTGADLRDICWVPTQLYDRGRIESILKEQDVAFELKDSFNPYYVPGTSKKVSWRFDIILQKS